VQIVDAQVHCCWSRGPPANPIHRQVEASRPPTPWDPLADELAIEAVRAHLWRLAIAGNLPLDKPASRALAADSEKQPGMLGLRFAFSQPRQQTWLTRRARWTGSGRPPSRPVFRSRSSREPSSRFSARSQSNIRGSSSSSITLAKMARTRYPNANVAIGATAAAQMFGRGISLSRHPPVPTPDM
jgi:hypothetical protein